MHVIAANQARRVRWKNDGGWTTELARDPPQGEPFNWRVSIAQIEQDGPFSSFPGIDRELLLLDGNGIELDIDDAPPLRLAQRFERVHFAGEARVRCRLLAGPTRDFNVMVDRSRLHAETLARPLVGSMLIFAEPGTQWLIHVLSGHLGAKQDGRQVEVETGGSLRLDFRGGTNGRVALDGGGELLMVKFSEIAVP
ncbi:HutD family protein [Dokdonella sp.]|uniref:HutD/Ves family protein n=1 Tax=Dokdonella sp. TaxID=2291710 RepID=UPI0025B7D621|nr:HutD family protein [Dokdonella sp.]MBX3689997.1 HutD family protein [Dokdonella sp.]